MSCEASLDAQVARIRAEGGDVFTLRGDEPGSQAWMVSIDGVVHPAEWLDRGAAVAGYRVEKRRIAVRRGLS